MEHELRKVGTSFMNPEPRHFVLQALDPDHGSPVLEALFSVTDVDDLRALLADAANDPTLERGYFLDAAELAAINQRFGIAFDPEGRDVLLKPWHSIHRVPYLIHTGYELPLLLEGRKQLAHFSEAYPPNHHWNEEKFDRYVAEGALHREVVDEPFEEPIPLKHGKIAEGLRTVYYTRKGEEWRIPASKLIWAAAAKSKWSEDFERMQGMLFGYEGWQNDWWINDLRNRRRRFGCIPLCCAITGTELRWIEHAGYRALPPTDASVLQVSVLRAHEELARAQGLMDDANAAALVQFNVDSRRLLDIVQGQTGPNYSIPAGSISDLNRNIVGEIEIVASRTP